MKSIKHVINTWLLAIHIFAILVLLYDIVTTGNTEFRLLLFTVLFGALFSLPSLALCLLLFSPLSKAALPATAKLLLWILLVTLAIISSAALICYLLIDSLITWQEAPFVACAVLAALMAIVLRLQFFFQIVMHQSKAYENDLA